jgi:micrococcal nuclease
MRRRTATLWIIGFLLLAAWAGWDLVPGELSGTPGRADLEGRVVRVVDGDTVRVRLEGREETVRYIGVDTPETKRPGRAVECFGPAASAANERLVDGQEVRLEVGEEERDRYDRLLAYVHRADDGRFVNETLVREGYARPLAIEPNVRHADAFATLADEALEAGRGLWSVCER